MNGGATSSAMTPMKSSYSYFKLFRIPAIKLHAAFSNSLTHKVPSEWWCAAPLLGIIQQALQHSSKGGLLSIVIPMRVPHSTNPHLTWYPPFPPFTTFFKETTLFISDGSIALNPSRLSRNPSGRKWQTGLEKQHERKFKSLLQ